MADIESKIAHIEKNVLFAEDRTELILALIAADRKPLVEALKKVHIEFDAIKHTRLLSFSEMQLDKAIDSALKEVQNG
jgi:hypothetical protein